MSRSKEEEQEFQALQIIEKGNVTDIDKSLKETHSIPLENAGLNLQEFVKRVVEVREEVREQNIFKIKQNLEDEAIIMWQDFWAKGLIRPQDINNPVTYILTFRGKDRLKHLDSR